MALLDTLFSVCERIFALLLIVLALPLMLLIGLAIRLDSPGRAIFTQQRIACLRGRRAKTQPIEADGANPPNDPPDNALVFTLYKFRTFHENSDRLLPKRSRFDFEQSQINEIQLQLKNDPRVTRIGKILRRTSLDELPNFINVVIGDMRLIGPRPEVREMYRYYTKEQRIKFTVRPGITGLAQVSGRGKLNFKQTVDYDLWYVRHRSWRLDLWILFRTIKVVLTGDGSF